MQGERHALCPHCLLPLPLHIHPAVQQAHVRSGKVLLSQCRDETGEEAGEDRGVGGNPRDGVAGPRASNADPAGEGRRYPWGVGVEMRGLVSGG